MMKKKWIGGIGLTFLIAVLFSPVVAGGQYVQVGLQVSGSGTVEETFETDINWVDVYANPDTRYTWNLPASRTYPLGDHSVTLESLSIAVEGDPTIELGFSAVSHDGPATFLFTSDVLNFDPLTDVSAYVYATANALPGTTVSAANFPGKLCRILYNGTQIFADVVNPFSFVPGGVYEYIPPTPIAGEVSSMQVMWSLSVNSGGHASGLCVFDLDGTVIPEPASVILLGLGGLALLRKHKGRS
jgi:hypothetical protein